MGEILQFPKTEKNQSEDWDRYYSLLEDLEKIESELKSMCDAVDGFVYAELPRKAEELLIDMQLELADMRRRKFFSPIKRREMLKKLRETRKIWKESEGLLESYEEKSLEFYNLSKKLRADEVI